MKIKIDFTIVWYLSLVLALISMIPGLEAKETLQSLSSGIFLFLESMALVIYLVGIGMTLWFLYSKKSVVSVSQPEKSSVFSQPAKLPLARTKIILVVFLAFSPYFPNQQQLIFLLAANALARLIMTLLTRKTLKKAQEIKNNQS